MRYLQIFAIFMVCTMLGAGMGCKRDKCKRVTCVNGTCVDGTCNCATGYFNEDCSAIINAGLDGTWMLQEQCTAGSDSYEVLFAASSASMVQVQITGLWGRQIAVCAEIASDGAALQIVRQRLGSVEVDANGTIDDDRTEITLQYNVYQLGAAQAFDVCTATISKN